MTNPPPPDEWYDPSAQGWAPPRRVERGELNAAGRRLLGVIGTLTLACVAYRLVFLTGTWKASALYVGVPALLAVGLVLTKPAHRSATSTAMRGSTLALLLAGIVLPEGVICLLMAAPLVYVVAALVGAGMDNAAKRGGSQRGALLLITIPLLIASMEGVAGSPFDDRESVTSTRVVAASPAQVEAALSAAPRFDQTDVPRFLTWGFNRATGSTGEGLAVGDERVIHFTGGDHDDHPLRLWGGTGEPAADHHATMRLRIVESQPGRVVFSVVDDGTMTSKWAELRRTIVTWDTAATTTTAVSWTVEYRRLLSPAAYFGPIQRYGMAQAADYLLDATVGAPVP